MSQPAEDPEQTTVSSTEPPLPWVCLGALAVATAGLFLPWVSSTAGTRMGVQTNPGILFTIVLVVTVLLTGPQVRRIDRQTTWALVASWFVLLALAIYAVVRFSALTVDAGPVTQVGAGLYLCTLSGAVGTAAATLAVADRWLAQCADPWMKTRTRWLPAVAVGTMLFALCAVGLVAHDSVHPPSLSITAPTAAAGAHTGSAALGAPTAAGSSPTTAVVSAAPSTVTSTEAGNTGNTAPTGPGDFPGIAMDTIWPGYTGAPGTSYVWPGYLVAGNTGATGGSGPSGATGASGVTGNTGAVAPSTTTTVPVAASSMATTAPTSADGNGSGSGSGQQAD